MLVRVTTPDAGRTRTLTATRRFWCLAALGLSGSAALVVLAAPLQSAGARTLLGRWDGWARYWAPWPSESKSFTTGGLLFCAAVLVLFAAWALASHSIIRGAVSTRGLVMTAAAWCIPFALAPPILSRDAYSYLAQGAVGRAGGDPYRSPQVVLSAASHLVRAADPLYRGRVPPYGPLALKLFEGCLAVARGNGVLALISLRALVLLCVALTAWCGWRFAPPHRRQVTLWLIGANPLILMDLVGGLHVEGFVVVLLATAFTLAGRRSPVAAALVVTAAAVKVTALVAVVALLLHTFRRGGWRALACDVIAASASLGALTLLLQPNPFGWISGLGSPLKVWNPVSLPTTVALVWATLTRTSPDPVLNIARPILLAVGLVVALLIALRGRALSTVATAGYLIAAITLSGPVLWPWYVVPIVVLLVLGGSAAQTASAIALSGAAAFSNLPMPVVQMQRVDVVAAVAAAGGLLLWRLRAADTYAPAARASAPEGQQLADAPV